MGVKESSPLFLKAQIATYTSVRAAQGRCLLNGERLAGPS